MDENNEKGKRVERVGIAMQEAGKNMAGCGCLIVIIIILISVLMLLI